jgi:hypothetical protein
MKILALMITVLALSAAATAQTALRGAPYSAEAVTETIQPLVDGNKIVRRTVSRLYRDNEGRTRREDMKTQLGVAGAVVDVPQSIVITDPVAGVRYDLDTKKNSAKATSYKASFGYVPTIPALPAKVAADMRAPIKPIIDAIKPAQTDLTQEQVAAIIQRQKEMVERQNQAEVRMAEREKQMRERQNELAKRAVELERERAERVPRPDEHRSKTEHLGTQTIEGVAAEGTRTTTTIPAGAIGN